MEPIFEPIGCRNFVAKTEKIIKLKQKLAASPFSGLEGALDSFQGGGYISPFLGLVVVVGVRPFMGWGWLLAPFQDGDSRYTFFPINQSFDFIFRLQLATGKRHCVRET